ncbi:MAG: FAD-binding oxidoreductase [Myxococcota bacterium]
MSEAHPFHEVSPWFEAPEEARPALEADVSADVVIVGGGYTGLSAALSLRAAGIDVVVLEQGVAGSGSSGRNAGHVTPTIGKDLPTLLKVFGEERAKALVRFADFATEYAEDVIARHEIECDYHPSGNIIAGVHPKHEAKLERAAETARGLGAAVRYLSPGAMRERGIPPAFVCGVLEERGGTLNPGKYVRGLREAALRAGVTLYENTTVTRVHDGKFVRVETPGGSVRAHHAILATNAYTDSTGRRRRHVVPLRVSLFETEPIPEESRRELGWAGREGIYTAHEALENFRLTAHGTLSGGSKVVRYRYGSQLGSGRDPGAFDAIEAAFRERFPMLDDVRVAHFWGGWIGITLDLLPQIGVEGAYQNVHYAIGFNGHGVPQATLCGAMLADRILGKVHPQAAALDRRHWAWPVEPLRFAGAAMINGAMSIADRRTDRQVRRLRESEAAPASAPALRPPKTSDVARRA